MEPKKKTKIAKNRTIEKLWRNNRQDIPSVRENDLKVDITILLQPNQ